MYTQRIIPIQISIYHVTEKERVHRNSRLKSVVIIANFIYHLYIYMNKNHINYILTMKFIKYLFKFNQYFVNI